MSMRWCIPLLVGATLCGGAEAGNRRPNIVIILADDYGFGDCSMHGCKDIPTPHIDSIARRGVRCTSGYVSAPQCSPTRAGLLTGRYQQRFGHEFNAAIEDSALSLSETTLASRLRAAGYATGLVGKWHLGSDEQHQPLARGFQEFFGFLGGANPYLPQSPKGTVPRVLRGREDAGEKQFLTEALGREAVAFVDRHQREPFFLYLAFNAPHGPLQATEPYLKRFAGIKDETRRTYAAMVAAMDDAIGQVLAKLREAGLEEDTLVFFLSDNGGPTDVNASSNRPWRGVKGEVREGGVRVPLLVQWPKHLPAGQTYDQPVIQLDIHPTALAAAGAAIGADAKLDGVDLLPYLTGKKAGPPHETLYWRFSFPPTQPDRY
jgi:arylsulfatase A-like enzyme